MATIQQTERTQSTEQSEIPTTRFDGSTGPRIIGPRDGKFVVQITNTRSDATRFNILVQPYADQYSQDGVRLHRSPWQGAA